MSSAESPNPMADREEELDRAHGLSYYNDADFPGLKIRGQRVVDENRKERVELAAHYWPRDSPKAQMVARATVWFDEGRRCRRIETLVPGDTPLITRAHEKLGQIAAEVQV